MYYLWIPEIYPTKRLNNTSLSTQRVVQIDALRGFSLLGILLVNIFVFNAPYAHYSEFYGALEEFEAKVLESVISLAGGKFMFIFAFLFGYGAFMQFEKMGSLPQFRQFWFRRMTALALFGLLHLLLFWFGDILLPYALLGFLIPFMITRSQKVLITIGLISYFFPVVFSTLQQSLGWSSIGTQSPYSLAEFITVFSEGSFADIFNMRWHEYWSFRNEKLVFYIPKEFGLFMLGIVAAKNHLLTKITGQRYLVYFAKATLLVAAWTVFKGDIFEWTNPSENKTIIPFLIALNTLFEFLHGAAYIIGFMLCWRIGIFKWLLHPLQFVGRMSLTQYFVQSLVCVFIFYSYGLGYYGQLSSIQLVALSIAIYSIQVVFSALWLSRFKQGPLEKIWRRFSYGATS